MIDIKNSNEWLHTFDNGATKLQRSVLGFGYCGFWARKIITSLGAFDVVYACDGFAIN